LHLSPLPMFRRFQHDGFHRHAVILRGAYVGSAIVETVPLMIGSALDLASIIMVLLLLRRAGGLVIALSFIAGITATRLVQGALFGIAAGNVDTSEGSNDARTIVTVLLLVIGILMLVTALRLFLKGDDPDAPPPKWMQLVGTMTAPTACAIGAGILLITPKHWVFMLGAIGVIREADVSRTQAIVVFLLFVLGAMAFVIAPILAYIAAPTRSGPVLRGLASWMERYNRQITIAVSLFFGVYFVWKSLEALLR
jgi:hypothetical protein